MNESAVRRHVRRAAFLFDAMQFAGWRIVRLDETESTNDAARGGRAGEVYVARRQTAGRGRIGHRWLAEPGANLTMSAVIDVSGLDAQAVATLPLAVGLAVAEAFDGAVAGIGLKWPNDVLVAERKLAGILCERDGGNAIAGIGVNVRQTRFAPEIAGRAVSLARLGVSMTVEEALDATLASLARVAVEWKDGGFAAIWPRIAAFDLLKGKFVRVVQTDGDESPAEGLCGGVAEDGSLDVGGRKIWAGEAIARHVGFYGRMPP